MNHLIPCPECHRHLRRTEVACPFCGTAVAEAFAASQPRPLPSGRLSRAALMTFAAASIATSACSSSADDSGERGQGVNDAATDGTVGTGGNDGTGGSPASGGGTATGGTNSMGGAGGSATGGQPGTGGELAVPLYGAVPPPDAGADADKPDADDTDGSVAALYGAVPAYGISPAK